MLYNTIFTYQFTIMIQGTQIKVRILSYKSYRHYGGREINTTAHICNAKYLFSQQDTEVVELIEDCGGYKKGHKIAVIPNNFNIQ